MGKQIEINDFKKIIPELREILETHNIDKEQHYSIISDILFSFSYFIDQHQNSYLHETITSYIDDNYELLSNKTNEIRMIGELQIVFGNKRKFTTNILNIHLIDKSSLIDNLIGVLRLKDIGETLSSDEINKKFKSLVIENREGIYALRFRRSEDISKDIWIEFNCKDYSYECKDINELAENVYHFINRQY